MLTAGAVVVASFACVSALVQLVHSVESRSARAKPLQQTQNTASRAEVPPDNTWVALIVNRMFKKDRSIALWYESAAVLLFCGNGLVWLVATNTGLVGGCPDTLSQTTSTIAILSALAFAGALGRYFMACSGVLLAASSVVLSENWQFRGHSCGAVSISIAITVVVITATRLAQLVAYHTRLDI